MRHFDLATKDQLQSDLSIPTKIKHEIILSEMSTDHIHTKKWDTSIIVAILAVLISTISTYIGIKESQIMLKQQSISLEQQAASVWPYLENIPINNYSDEMTKGLYKMVVINKGVGPAIIDTVKYELKGKEIKGWALGTELQLLYPNLKISQLQNATLDKRVLSPGEKHTVISVQIEKEKSDTTDLTQILNKMNFNLSYCYCSIYGKCWKIAENFQRSESKECHLQQKVN